jgi:ferredoxin-type protein NapG
LDRRSFFTRGAGKVAKAVTDHSAEQVRKNASRWIRPPFALDELEFLLACTRCDACIDACPHGVIFPLSAKLGAKVTSTPGMDLLNKGCHLCEGWECVTACEAGALKLPQKHESEQQNELSVPDAYGEQYKERFVPKIANAVINKETCLPYSGPECGACKVCPVEGAMEWIMEKPEINQSLCTGCALCREACIVDPKAILITSKYQKEEKPSV